jgi:RNA-directed DNA polymerase
MNERGLRLSAEKTRITHIAEGFDFLGQNVRKYNGKLIIKPTKKNVKAHLTQIRDIIRTNPTAKAGTLVMQLNPVIRGWANYHRHVCSKNTFTYTDNATYKALWHWARRRHPDKGVRWVQQKYLKTVGQRHWVFSGIIKDHEGKTKRVPLLPAAYTPIRRHVKIQAKANPYDPQWEMYFEERVKSKMEDTGKGKRNCSTCGKPKKVAVPIAGNSSHKRQVGTSTIGRGAQMAVVTKGVTWKWCIRPATGKFITKDYLLQNRVPQGAFERLEPDEGKLSCPVPRGLGGSNALRLPGTETHKFRRDFCAKPSPSRKPGWSQRKY